MMAQRAFALPFRTAMDAEDFIVTDSNRLAIAMIDQWPAWPSPIIILHGAKGSGKSHLGQVWGKMSHAHTVSANAMARSLESLLQYSDLIIEDIEQITGLPEQEQALFHLCNHIRQDGGHMLMTAARPPAQLGFILPDLRSRLLSYPVIALLPPDDDLLAALLVKQFADRQIHIGQEVIDYLLPRLERTATAVTHVVAALDAAALERKSRITVPLARAILATE